MSTEAIHNGAQIPNPWKELPSQRLEMSAPVGLSTLPKQHLRKMTQKGFCFNLMLLGEAGLGKTTLFNTLFDDEILTKPEMNFEERKKSKFTLTSFDIEEEDVKVAVRVFESNEFGIHMKREEGIHPVITYLQEQLDLYFDKTEGQTREPFEDTRIHACLYFIRPTGHELSELDIKAISEIHDKVNVIPIIAKADTFTLEECRGYKQTILRAVSEHKFKVYPFHFDPSASIPEYPYAVIGSEGNYEVGGKSVRGRKFKWGVAQVDNPEHCDFVKLRELLIRDNCLDLIDKTDMLYEEYRKMKLLAKGVTDVLMESDDDFQEKLELQRKEWLAVVEKEEKEVQAKYARMVAEEDKVLKAKEDQLMAQREKNERELSELRARLKKEKEELEEMQNELETDDSQEGGNKEEKKKKRMSLSGVTKSMRKKT